MGTVLRSHHIAKSGTEQCGGSNSDWEAEVYKGFKSCSAAGSGDTAIAGSQTLPSTAPGVLQAHGYSLKLESATQRTQNAVQTLQQTSLPFPRGRANAVPQADRRFENRS